MSYFDYILGKADALRGREPLTLNGQVVNEPYGYEYPEPVYYTPSPLQRSLVTLSRDDLHLILLGMFFLLALALVTRK